MSIYSVALDSTVFMKVDQILSLVTMNTLSNFWEAFTAGLSYGSVQMMSVVLVELISNHADFHGIL